MGFFRYLTSLNKWNADPVQQRISRMLIDVVEGRQNPAEIVLFIEEQGWPKTEKIDRLTHALSVVKISRGDLYPDAQELYRQVGTVLKAMPSSAQTKDAASFNRHLRALAEKGDADSQYKLGTAYDEGLGVSQDYTEAFKWFRFAAEQGHANSQFRVGDMYMSGNGVAKNDTEAVKWVRKAAEQGLANAQGMLGITYAKGEAVSQDYVLAYMWLHLASQGRPGADQFRDAVGERMTAAQVAEAQKLAREWKALKGR